MADEKKLQLAKTNYETLCRALDSHDWRYQRHDDDLVISSGYKGDAFPYDLVFRIDAERQSATLYCPLPFRIDEDKRVEAACAVCVANDGMVLGRFDLDIESGKLTVWMNNAFDDTQLAETVFWRMLCATLNSAERYVDRFHMLNKGYIDFAKFVEMDKSN